MIGGIDQLAEALETVGYCAFGGGVQAEDAVVGGVVAEEGVDCEGLGIGDQGWFWCGVGCLMARWVGRRHVCCCCCWWWWVAEVEWRC